MVQQATKEPWGKPVEYTFGAPMAPTEIWQGFAEQHRCLTSKLCDEKLPSFNVKALLCSVRPSKVFASAG